MLLPTPSPRKEAILSLVPPAALAAEIGADHGILSAHLLSRNICKKMLVSDVSAASLEKAKRLFLCHGLQARAVFAVADGLAALEGVGAVDAILLAGMGGQTMLEIVAGGRARIGAARLVLQPNTKLPQLRGWLCENGFAIIEERLALENGRFYVALRAESGQAPLTEAERLLGPWLLQNRPPLFSMYLRFRIRCLEQEKTPEAGRALEIHRAALAEDLLSCEHAVQ